MPTAYVDHKTGYVVAVRESTPSIVPARFLAITTNANEDPVAGDKFDANANPRFIASLKAKRHPKWTAFEFLLRFTEAERASFRDEAATDPKVADFMLLCSAASQVEADHPMTVAGMDYLVSIGLLTQARANEILGK